LLVGMVFERQLLAAGGNRELDGCPRQCFEFGRPLWARNITEFQNSAHTCGFAAPALSLAQRKYSRSRFHDSSV
jgi:hypothetical protein